ncbi:Trm112 family protein [Nocardioides panacisoli]|uniref:Trm112 family protein n=1 Tax=Nocardioides panacisoli TaxID=627624 RepID=UPI001F20C9F5|nr:Trm112 family protein [Nocardioides panacisoli]
MSESVLPQELLDIIVCPDCHGALTPAPSTLTCTGCGLVYPIRDQIPVLLVDEATRPTP